MKINDQVLIVDGAFQGRVGTITQTDGEWLFLVLRDGTLLWLAASICRVCEDGEGSN